MSDEQYLDQETGIDEDEYEGSPRPPVPVDENGKAILFQFARIVEQDDDFKHGFTGKGNIYFIVKHKVQGGEHDGAIIRVVLGTTPSPFRKATGADDYLRACGITRTGRSNRDYLNAVEEGESKTFEATTDWIAECPDCENDKGGWLRVLKKYRDFPLGEDGVTRKHEVECSDCGGIISAKWVVKRYVVPR